MLLAAGCGALPVGPRQVTVPGCAGYGVYAIDHGITVTRMPAACQGLSKAQINEAAASAINMVVGGRSKSPAWRRRTAEVAPRLAYLITGPQPAPGSPPQTSQLAGGTPVRAGTGSDMALSLAALGAWLITAGSGACLLVSWIIRSGIPRRPRTARAGAPPAVQAGPVGFSGRGAIACTPVHVMAPLRTKPSRPGGWSRWRIDFRCCGRWPENLKIYTVR